MSEYGSERRVNAGRLWSGGLATAVVAALIILVGALVVRGVLGIPVLAPEEAGYAGDAGTAAYAVVAGIAALVATALLHLLLVSAPRATTFFGWIVGLATIVAAVSPFTQEAALPSQLATAVINTVTGIAIVSLLSSVGATAVRRRRPSVERDVPESAEFDDSGYSSGYRDALGESPARRYDGRHRGNDPYDPARARDSSRE
ncbi:DUF6069 family protein [Streptomonospora litoralis]|uniref:Uncharacterized protein n=1 Tax=Streptomonospora litoralis TaxID=2498135 RepID=A0A4P6Q9H2_9ACTN|nr:DUF6069 family protein [Streptomonospora litoralis]QBI55904.1 hypothetical protein EKD16_20725 [Streptomonospora litoralis]